MKIRKFVLPALVLLLVLSSCSSSRFGNVPKVKAKKQVAVTKKAPEKKVAENLPALENKAQEITGVAADYQIPVAVVDVPENTATAPAPKTDNAQAAQPKTTQKDASAEQLLSPKQVKQLKKLQKIEKQTKTNEVSKGGWLWYVIIGIVFMLVGGLIGTVIGGILALVGIIAIIYGLLMLLGIV